MTDIVLLLLLLRLHRSHWSCSTLKIVSRDRHIACSIDIDGNVFCFSLTLAMNGIKRRSRTGCLTCRARRVKCDERKPMCERCEFANVECAGYAGKRSLAVGRSMQSSTSTTSTTSPSDPGYPGDATIRPQVRQDGLPLIALPNNPTSLQLPHTRARDVLAFHQFLFRTMPILFPPASLSFWRDYVCQEAWGVEYVFDAVVALGCMHRATLLLSQQTESDRDHGFDTKVSAIQMYSNALKGVSDSLASTQISMPLLLGVLILFAYTEVRTHHRGLLTAADEMLEL